MNYKILLILFLLIGCRAKVTKEKEYVYVKGEHTFFGISNGMKWYKAEILEKDGAMWKVKVNGTEQWINIKELQH